MVQSPRPQASGDGRLGKVRWRDHVGQGDADLEAPDFKPVIRVAITQAAFDAIAASMTLGSVACEAEVAERLIWLEARWVDTLRALRGDGESYSDVIMRLAVQEMGSG